MSSWPIVLSMEDVFILADIVLFLLIQQRAARIIVIILVAMLLLCNVLAMSGYHNWFVLALPIATLSIVAIVGRPFLKHPLFAISPKIVNALVIIGVVLLLFSTVLIIIIVNQR